jgi:hypothetical protein
MTLLIIFIPDSSNFKFQIRKNRCYQLAAHKAAFFISSHQMRI